ncbi:MAG TPA: hypothetical protein VGD39_10660 [Nocardioides sp.]
MELLAPRRFQLHPDDHETYGDAWYTYDEAAIVRLPVGEQRDIERQTGMSLLQMFTRGRNAFIDGLTAQMWVARRMAGVTEPFDGFSPIVLLSTWEEGGDADPPADSPSSSRRAASKPSSNSSSRSSRSSRASRPAN